VVLFQYFAVDEDYALGFKALALLEHSSATTFGDL
jgi:hypothetical protein